jgi:hypothetical protein
VMATRVEHVERISGKGRLTAGENVYTVDYVINIYQRYAESTPLPRFARGRLTGMNAVAVVRAMSPLKALDLELQDGRHAQVILENLDGDFDVTGAIRPAPEQKRE